MSDKPVVIKVWVECGWTMDEEEVEVDRAEWDAMTPAERSEYATECAVTHQNNVAPCGFEIAE